MIIRVEQLSQLLGVLSNDWDNCFTLDQDCVLHVGPKPPLWMIAAGLATVYLVWGSTYLAIGVAGGKYRRTPRLC